MKIIVADTGALISLIHINQLQIIEEIFGEYYIAEAVWDELVKYDNPYFDKTQLENLKAKTVKISAYNYLSLVMDYGESESVILYQELNANWLLIDDNKARQLAESLNVNCIGTLGVLLQAKQRGIIKELKPQFEKLLLVGRYFSIKLLNNILLKIGESKLKVKKS